MEVCVSVTGWWAVMGIWDGYLWVNAQSSFLTRQKNACTLLKPLVGRASALLSFWFTSLKVFLALLPYKMMMRNIIHPAIVSHIQFSWRKESRNLCNDLHRSKTVETLILEKSCTDISKLQHDPWFQLSTDIAGFYGGEDKNKWFEEYFLNKGKHFFMKVGVMINLQLPVWTTHAI